ncbi:MAG: hypothetical protein RBS43_08805 [Candidatus Cloacimonas sp.]|jgi:putative CRISPR-associated protein (TIGR02619 family)|nr:hypothetical protein [Candidatus Cloacimonas sp.]
MKVIITPVGTSSLTNGAEESIRQLLAEYANAPNRDDIPNQQAAALDSYVQKRRKFVDKMDKAEAKKNSAELHSLLILFEEDPPEPRDIIYLIPTATYIGRLSTLMVSDFLKRMNLNVQELIVPGLQTKCSADLRAAFSELVLQIDAISQQYKPQQARLIFNLTGGFKAIQGFLQTLSVVYADETIYIFERERELMRIPRLPFKMEAKDYVVDNLLLWRRLDLGLTVDCATLKSIPDTFLFWIGDECILSEYGTLVWNNVKGELYDKEFLEPPSSKIALASGFLRSIAGLQSLQLCQLNSQVDKLAKYLETDAADMLKSLSFKKITAGAKPGSTHEFYAWSDNGAKRVFCHYDTENQVVLDALGDHL